MSNYVSPTVSGTGSRTLHIALHAWFRVATGERQMPRKVWATSNIDWKKEYAYWGWLRAQLPDEGVDKAFPDEASCLSRLIEVRWKGEIACPQCAAENPFNVSARELWQCRQCDHQFSATSGTLLDNSKLPLKTWFVAAEHIIQNSPHFSKHKMPPIAEFQKRVGTHRNTAGRLRRKIYDELRNNGNQGFLGQLVLTNQLNPPKDIDFGSPDFYAWQKNSP